MTAHQHKDSVSSPEIALQMLTSYLPQVNCCRSKSIVRFKIPYEVKDTHSNSLDGWQCLPAEVCGSQRSLISTCRFHTSARMKSLFELPVGMNKMLIVTVVWVYEYILKFKQLCLPMLSKSKCCEPPSERTCTKNGLLFIHLTNHNCHLPHLRHLLWPLAISAIAAGKFQGPTVSMSIFNS